MFSKAWLYGAVAAALAAIGAFLRLDAKRDAKRDAQAEDRKNSREIEDKADEARSYVSGLPADERLRKHDKLRD